MGVDKVDKGQIMGWYFIEKFPKKKRIKQRCSGRFLTISAEALFGL
jgi:hypothetical protein